MQKFFAKEFLHIIQPRRPWRCLSWLDNITYCFLQKDIRAPFNYVVTGADNSQWSFENISCHV